jgi:hypothetical protein
MLFGSRGPKPKEADIETRTLYDINIWQRYLSFSSFHPQSIGMGNAYN